MASRIAPQNAPRVLAIVQAGGKGARMGVLTAERAKPALPVGGTHQLIDIALSNLANSGIADVWVSVQYLASSLDEHVQHGRPWDLDRSEGGFRRVVPEQAPGELSGGFSTGNADNLYRIRREIAAEDADVVLVLSADQIFSLDLRELVDAHVSAGADVTLATAEVTKSEAAQKAVVVIDATGRITQIHEKPENPDRTTVFAEIMAFNKDALLQTLEDVVKDTAPGAEEGDTGLGDVAERLLPTMISRGLVKSFALQSYWRDMGRPAVYLTAHRDLVRGKVGLFRDPSWPMRTLGVDGGPARISESLIAAGAIVEGTVIGSTLGPRVVVRPGAHVEDSVIFSDCVIEADAHIHTSIVDSDVTVRSGARIGRAPKATRALDGDIAVVGHSSVIEGRVQPGEQIEPGSTVR